MANLFGSLSQVGSAIIGGFRQPDRPMPANAITKEWCDGGTYIATDYDPDLSASELCAAGGGTWIKEKVDWGDNLNATFNLPDKAVEYVTGIERDEVAARTVRRERAAAKAHSLRDLKSQAAQNILNIEKRIAEARASGAGSLSGLNRTLDEQREILDRINEKIDEGDTVTTDLNLIEGVCNFNNDGILSLGTEAERTLRKSSYSLSRAGGNSTGYRDLAESSYGSGSTGEVSSFERGTYNRNHPSDFDDTVVYWDAPNVQGMTTGKFDDEIVAHVEPKLKHAYQGEFPGKMGVLNWLIKTMDRPKIDIESVEQMRNNVKRNYPIRYNFGDLSITFWDDVKHVTISTITNYFHGSVWAHGGEKQNRGEFLLRDSIVIPQFTISDYVMESNSKLVYTFYNSVLSSFDFDGHDDEDDAGVHTVQVVLKIEGFSVKKDII